MRGDYSRVFEIPLSPRASKSCRHFKRCSRATSPANSRVAALAHRATISDNLGESARDMLIFPIFPATMRVCTHIRGGATTTETTTTTTTLTSTSSRYGKNSRIERPLSMLCSRFICNHPPPRPSTGRIVLLLRCARFHRFAVSPRACAYRVCTELQRNLNIRQTKTRCSLLTRRCIV